jgi:hypothetical protein
MGIEKEQRTRESTHDMSSARVCETTFLDYYSRQLLVFKSSLKNCYKRIRYYKLQARRVVDETLQRNSSVDVHSDFMMS